MRYSLYINQPVAIELGMENTTEAIIFDYLIIAPTWAETMIINEQVYYWVARQKICKEHELLHIQPKTVYRYFKKLHEKGLIDYKKLGKKDCMRITKIGKKYISTPMGNLNSSTMGIINSQKEEFKIQSNGNLKSTYNTINTIPLSKESLSREKYLKSFDSFVSYLRANFINKEIVKTKDLYTEKIIRLSITNKGMLYDMNTSENFQALRAKEIYASLYKLAKEGKIKNLKENK